MSSYKTGVTQGSILVTLHDDIQTLKDLSQIVSDMHDTFAAQEAIGSDTATEETFKKPLSEEESARIQRRFKAEGKLATWGDLGTLHQALLDESIVGNLIRDDDDVQRDFSALGLNPKDRVRYEEILDLHYREQDSRACDGVSEPPEIGPEASLDLVHGDISQASVEQPLTPEQSRALSELLKKKLTTRQLKLPWTY